jgi:hypothetical protein
MHKLRTLLLCLNLAFLCACSRKPSAKEGRAKLVGHYQLHIGSSCAENGIEFASLTLDPTGKYGQEGKFKNGTSYKIGGKKWEYNGDGNIWLDGLRVGKSLEISPEAEMTNASLIVEFSQSPSILLDPDANCFFEKDR